MKAKPAICALALVTAMAVGLAQAATSDLSAIPAMDGSSPVPAVADGAPSGEVAVELERMTWPELARRMANGTKTVIVPTGGTEQNGRHMVLGKHNLIVRETARRIARQLGNTVVAPVLAYVPEGAPDAKRGHMGFPGTLSLRPETFAAVLRDTAESLRTHGFRTIVFLGDSGGNQAVQAELAEELTSQWANEGVRVIHAGRYYAANKGNAFLQSRGFSSEDIGTHAGIRDTSELMAVAPAGIRRDRLGLNTVSEGANGRSDKASAELGRRLLKLKVEAGLEDIRAGLAADPGGARGSPPPAQAAGFLGWLSGLMPF